MSLPTRVPRPALTAVVAVLLLLSTLVLATPAAAAEQTRTFRYTFSPDAGETLRLANLVGSMRLVPGSGDEVTAVVTVHAEGDSAAETRRLLQDMKWVPDPDRGGYALSYPVDRIDRYRFPKQGDGGVEIFGWNLGSRTTTTYLGERVSVTGSGGTLLYAEVRVTYPARVPLAVRQVVGGVTGDDLYGEVRIDTGSGDVKLRSFNGDLTVDTGSGDIDVGAFRGGIGIFDTGSGDVEVAEVEAESVTADTGSGDVSIRNGRVGDLVADTGSGDVEIVRVAVRTANLDTGSGDVLLRGDLSAADRVVADTGSGDVEIYGGPDAQFRVWADQGSGELRVGYDDAELEYEGRDRKVVGATRGDGRTRIEIDTGSGDAVVSPG